MIIDLIIFLFIIISIILLLLPVLIRPPIVPVTIRGKTLDADGMPVPEVTVKLTGDETDLTVASDAEGNYVLPAVPPEAGYHLVARKDLANGYYYFAELDIMVEMVDKTVDVSLAKAAAERKA